MFKIKIKKSNKKNITKLQHNVPNSNTEYGHQTFCLKLIKNKCRKLK